MGGGVVPLSLWWEAGEGREALLSPNSERSPGAVRQIQRELDETGQRYPLAEPGESGQREAGSWITQKWRDWRGDLVTPRAPTR